MSHYEAEKYYDTPKERGEVDWSKEDDEGYYASQMGEDY